MDKELRELFNGNNIIINGITIKGNVIIINNKFVIKKRDVSLEDTYKYLKSRGFNYFPEIVYKTLNYDVYEYVNDIDISLEEKSFDFIKLVSLLHSKTTFYKEIDDNTYKELYENIVNKINYLFQYYSDIADVIDRDDYMSPSKYYFVRNISLVFASLDYAKYQIDKWYSILEEKKRVRIVHIHNNLSLDHYLLSDRSYLISWNKSKKDLPIYDLVKLYEEYYSCLDFCDLLKNYERYYPLLEEERILFFVLISIPSKLEFDVNEIDMCKRVGYFYKYLLSSNKLIGDYLPKEKKVNV